MSSIEGMSVFEVMEAKAMLSSLYDFMKSTINMPYDRNAQTLDNYPNAYNSNKVVSLIKFAIESKDKSLIEWLQSFDYSLPEQYAKKKSNEGLSVEAVEALIMPMQGFHLFVSDEATHESRITDVMVSEFGKFVSDSVAKDITAREILNYIDMKNNTEIGHYLFQCAKQGNMKMGKADFVLKELWEWLKDYGFKVKSYVAFADAYGKLMKKG